MSTVKGVVIFEAGVVVIQILRKCLIYHTDLLILKMKVYFSSLNMFPYSTKGNGGFAVYGM